MVSGPPPAAAATAPEKARPMLPVANASHPAPASACARNSVSVVFPLVPVTATIRPRQHSDAKSS